MSFLLQLPIAFRMRNFSYYLHFISPPCLLQLFPSFCMENISLIPLTFCKFFRCLLHEIMSPHLSFVSPRCLLNKKVIFVKTSHLEHYIRDWTNNLLPSWLFWDTWQELHLRRCAYEVSWHSLAFCKVPSAFCMRVIIFFTLSFCKSPCLLHGKFLFQLPFVEETPFYSLLAFCMFPRSFAQGVLFPNLLTFCKYPLPFAREFTLSAYLS